MSFPSNCELPLQSNIQDNSEEHINTLNESQNLRMSFHSLDLRESINKDRTKNKISLFCEQERLMADKDLRIQELLMEERSFKNETGFIIHSLQNEAYQSNHHRNSLLQQIDRLKSQNEELVCKLERKDAKIQCLNKRVQNTDYIYQQFEKQVCLLRQQVTELKEQHAQIKFQKLSKQNQKQNINNNTINPQSDVMKNQKLNQSNPIVTNFILKLQREFKIENNDKSIQKKIQQILGRIQKANRDTQSNNERQINQINMRKQLLQKSYQSQVNYITKNILLTEEVAGLKDQIKLSQQTTNQLKVRLEQVTKQKQEKEVQLFNIKLKNEENKNCLKFELGRVPQLPQEEDELDQSLRESICFTEDNFQNNKHLQSFRLNKKVNELQKKVEEQNSLVKTLSEQLASEKKKLADFLKAAWQFGQDFGSFVDRVSAQKKAMKLASYNIDLWNCSTEEKESPVLQEREKIVIQQYTQQ